MNPLLFHVGPWVPLYHDASVAVQLVTDDLAQPKQHLGLPDDNPHAARGELGHVILDTGLNLAPHGI